MIFISCKENERTIERPVFEVRNTNTLEIDKIILTDTATILYVDAFFRPHNWIRIDSLTYLQGGDRKYRITGSEGIELSKEFWMPESGEASFVLIFPQVDRTLEKIDFIESDCDGCFKIYGIDLTGKAPSSGYPEGLPQELRDAQTDLSAPLPDAELKIGTTRVNLHLLGYRKGMTNGTCTMYSARFFPLGQDEKVIPIDEDTGKASVEFEQYGTTRSSIHAAGHSISFVSSPGETMDIYVDLQELGRRSSHYDKTEVTRPYLYFTGLSAAVNRALNSGNDPYKLKLGGEEEYNEIAGMSADEFTNYLIAKYKNLSGTINRSTTLSPLEKELIDTENKMMAQYFMLTGEDQLENAFRVKNKIPWEQRILENYPAPEFTGKHYEAMKEFRIDGTQYLYTALFSQTYPLFFGGKTNPETLTGRKDGFLYDLQKAYLLGRKAENGEPLTDREKAELESINNPFYANVLSAVEKNLLRQLEESKNKTGYTICEIPKVSEAQLFDAIVGKYKGKVVLVDLWATWCGPCRAALRQTEPLKDTELKSDHLVFVYLTGPSSPETKWRTMIADIKGEHYRLSEKQWRFICNQFEIDGIPSYVLVDRNGDYELRNDLRDHATLKKTLLEKTKDRL
ncbi:MAG: TlpA family protein disulfide reductase [Tannerella sp.]|jgi:thiol-disulfide isomerase/thioredoxin|nr:TlpA family protein disulfide reductase [Tannerella sp.]